MGKYTLPEGEARDLMTEWVEDLRTPGLLQIQGELGRRFEDGAVTHCCLGRLALLPGAKVTARYSDAGRLEVTGDPDEARELSVASMPPPSLISQVLGRSEEEETEACFSDTGDQDVLLADEWPEGTPEWIQEDAPFTASRANDSLHWTFPQIADALEARYLRD